MASVEVPFKLVESKQSGAGNRPVVVFVHHVGGSTRTLQRHVKRVSQQGFDSVVFNLSHHGPNPRRNFHIDYFAQWAREIESVLSQLARDKIIYSFSRPSTCVLKVISDHFDRNDFQIKGWVCDSGPFIMPLSYLPRVLYLIFKIQAGWLDRAIALPMMVTWAKGNQWQFRKLLRNISSKTPQFPILNFRGMQDQLVPPSQIAEVFRGQPLKNLNVVEMPNAGHLNGLRDFSEIYVPSLTSFLKQFEGEEKQ